MLFLCTLGSEGGLRYACCATGGAQAPGSSNRTLAETDRPHSTCGSGCQRWGPTLRALHTQQPGPAGLPGRTLRQAQQQEGKINMLWSYTAQPLFRPESPTQKNPKHTLHVKQGTPVFVIAYLPTTRLAAPVRRVAAGAGMRPCDPRARPPCDTQVSSIAAGAQLQAQARLRRAGQVAAPAYAGALVSHSSANIRQGVKHRCARASGTVGEDGAHPAHQQPTGRSAGACRCKSSRLGSNAASAAVASLRAAAGATPVGDGRAALADCGAAAPLASRPSASACAGGRGMP